MKRMIRFLTTATALLVLTCAAAAQQTPPPKTEPAKPKVKKVWTNDEVIDLRKPSDVYEQEKRMQAEEAAKAKQKAEADKAAPQTADDKQKDKPVDYLPKTVEDAEKLAAAKQYEIGQQYEAIDLVKQELAQAKTDESRAAFQKRIDQLTATLEESVAEMKAIDARLKELKAKAPAPPKPPTPQP
jgi:hypothetical protein